MITNSLAKYTFQMTQGKKKREEKEEERERQWQQPFPTTRAHILLNSILVLKFILEFFLHTMQSIPNNIIYLQNTLLQRYSQTQKPESALHMIKWINDKRGLMPSLSNPLLSNYSMQNRIGKSKE